MQDHPVPSDAPVGLRLRPLGGNSWLMDRRFYLSVADGTVWCREAGFGGFAAPRWRAVPDEEQSQTVLGGGTLAELALALAPQEEPSTTPVRKRQETHPAS